MKISKQKSLYEFPRVVEVSSRTKNSNKSAQSGRSMIEMLGVLAIIGVLTVGGIAGYSKAMQKYRINKTLDQITHIINNAKTTFAQQTSYHGICKAKDLGIFPDDTGRHYSYCDIDDEYAYYHFPSGEYASLRVSDSFSPHALLLNIFLRNDEANNVTETCTALASYDWKAALGEGLIGISVADSIFSSITDYTDRDLTDNSFFYYDTIGDEYPSVVAPAADLPLPMDKVASICQSKHGLDGFSFLNVGIIFK